MEDPKLSPVLDLRPKKRNCLFPVMVRKKVGMYVKKKKIDNFF